VTLKEVEEDGMLSFLTLKRISKGKPNSSNIQKIKMLSSRSNR